MIKQLWPYAKQDLRWIAGGVLCSGSEAVFELLIPLVMNYQTDQLSEEDLANTDTASTFIESLEE
jgi:hypothetical protein